MAHNGPVRPVVTPTEMADADRHAIAAGTPETVLIERAARAVARHRCRCSAARYGRRVVIACGKGNNGADGRVAAGILRRRGVGVDVVSTGGPAGDDVNRSAFVRALARADLFVDAMFGTGFRGALDR